MIAEWPRFAESLPHGESVLNQLSAIVSPDLH